MVTSGTPVPGRVLARFGDGFLEFYDVQIPFNPAAHPHMHGVLLVAFFAFTLCVALAAGGCGGDKAGDDLFDLFEGALVHELAILVEAARSAADRHFSLDYSGPRGGEDLPELGL